ncbi:pilus assembly protein N-terminal domain-containing protein [Salmonella enterica]|uniref:Type II and III secretion system protein family protein n=2 Tax=Salmonella enterica TaxID=28901 RepID=A0A607IEV6_SALET|nr:type II and III secretion system protein family protein [Salmonella enterica]EBS4769654.1 type II and III secretion system protein family protein [Salmonella enterica subsp. enterica serovar Sandiego]ECH8235006.1 type II and III secretion system protein family protein [Salmonella enterica subsp. enterica]EIB5177273.1 type II and III secretion system protein family protein [Salmonella enterica subsp. enterica serovar Maracaibo]EAB3910903.1 type II and III secretion system protein family prote
MIKKRSAIDILVSAASGVLLFISGTSLTLASIYLEPGDSRVFEIKGDKSVDSVFISSPSIADYEVITDNSIVVYGNKTGVTDFVVFDKDGNQLLKEKIVIDDILPNIHKLIKKHYPESDVTIERLGDSYILSGNVTSEFVADTIYTIVGEALGREKNTVNKKITASSDSGTGENGEKWLREVEYKGIINNLVIPGSNQVNVKLSVIEVTKEFTDTVGINWGSITGPGEALTPGVFRLVKFNADTISNLIHAIANDNIAKVLAEPNLSVLSGETADFLVGGEVPVVTSSSNGVNIQYKEYGIKLNIGAKVRDKENIRVSLSEEVSDIQQSFVSKSGDTFPSLLTRKARTTVDLADGDSFLLAGLISQNDYENLSRIPFIGDVPVIGALFRQTSTTRTRKELVVVATVTLVKPIKESLVEYPDIQTTSTVSRLFNLSEISDKADKKRAANFLNKGGFIK